MKTAVSLPDKVFLQADRMAKRLGKSRSALYREALEEYVARHDPNSITEAMNRVMDRVRPRPDPFLQAAARRTFERLEW